MQVVADLSGFRGLGDAELDAAVTAPAADVRVQDRAAQVGERLASANNRTNARRLASIITPITLATTLAATILFTSTTSQHAAAGQRSEGIRADAVVVASGPGVARDVVDAARSARGVTAVTAELRGTVRIGQDKYPATAATFAGLDRTLELGVQAGSTVRFGPHDVGLSTLTAGHRHVHVGDRLTITLGDGTKAVVRLAAVYSRGLAFGDVLLPYALLSAHVDQPMADDILVRGVAPATLATELHRLPGVRVLAPGQFRARIAAAQRTTAEVGHLAMGLVTVFAAIAVLNTLAMATLARTREFAALRLIGMKRGRLRTMVCLETAVAAGTGVTLGAVFAAGVLTAYARGMTPGFGPYAPPLTCAAILGVTVLLVEFGVALPTRAALRPGPADAINDLG